MIEKPKRETISNLALRFPSPELRWAMQPNVEESETLWDQVFRVCDRYGLHPREHCRVHVPPSHNSILLAESQPSTSWNCNW